jgi:hypothetical protein
MTYDALAGQYIKDLSRNVFVSLGPNAASEPSLFVFIPQIDHAIHIVHLPIRLLATSQSTSSSVFLSASEEEK